MRGDFSRRTHDPAKQYSAVLTEQGRLLTDADLEEEHRIVSGLHERFAADVVGPSGGPLDGAGFAIAAAGAQLSISKGRYYVDGILVESDSDVLLTTQPHPPASAGGWPAVGTHAIVLDVWRRLVTALDDPSLREVALGGPTTAVREQTVWQVRHVPMGANPNWSCASPMPTLPVTTGTLAARATPEQLQSTPCLVPPLAGYAGLENQLYRVEVITAGDAVDGQQNLIAVTALVPGSPEKVTVAANHQLQPGDYVEIVRTGAGTHPLDASFSQVTAVAGNTLTLATTVTAPGPGEQVAVRRVRAAAVMSRENGSVLTSIERIDGSDVQVSSLGHDDVLGFAPEQWVEITDDAIEFEASAPRRLYRVATIDTDTRTLTLKGAVTPLGAAAGIDPAMHPKLRRWDGVRAILTGAAPQDWIHVEQGIEVRFGAGTYQRDAWWSFPARTAVIDDTSGNIEWPQDAGGPKALAPFGVALHRAVLAAVQVTAVQGAPLQVQVVSDCRNLFPPLTELTSLLFVGGDGQEARTDDPAFPQLPETLVVRVANGSHPVVGAKVRFTTPDGGVLAPSIVTTDARGVAETAWRLHPSVASQTADAELLDAGGTPGLGQLVRFAATTQQQAAHGGGCCVSIGKDGDFATIEEALKRLIDEGWRDICLCLRPGDHEVGSLPLDVNGLDGALHLSIRGCGRTSRIFVHERFSFVGLASLRLADLDVRIPETEGDDTPDFGSLHTQGVPEVRLTDVQVHGRRDFAGVVRILDATYVVVQDCVIDLGREGERIRGVVFPTGLIALEIGPSEAMPIEKAAPAEIIVQNNLIGGDVCFYGRPNSQVDLNEDMLKLIESRLAQGERNIGGDRGTVHFSDNHLGRLRVGEQMVVRLQEFADGADLSLDFAYRSFLAGGNVFEGVATADPFVLPLVVARRVALAANHFTFGAKTDRTTTLVLAVIAQGATATSNLGESIMVRRTLRAAAVNVVAAAFDGAANVEIEFV